MIAQILEALLALLKAIPVLSKLLTKTSEEKVESKIIDIKTKKKVFEDTGRPDE